MITSGAILAELSILWKGSCRESQMAKKTVEDVDLSNKRVLMRVDFNVPIQKEEGRIADDTRIRAALPTIEYVLRQEGARCVLMSHLGRPKGKVVPALTMDLVATRLGELLGIRVTTAADCVGEEVTQKVAALRSGEVLLLENLRFHPEEEKNDSDFARQLAQFGEIYVNDAFGTAHRAHASTEGVAHYLPAVAGFLMDKEIRFLGEVLRAPEPPFVAIIGGAKVSTKIQVLKTLLPKVSTLIIGGGMCYTFLKAKGFSIGKSLLEEDFLRTADDLLQEAKQQGKELLLPRDHMVGDEFSENASAIHVDDVNVPQDAVAMDVGHKTLESYRPVISKARTIVWNGPVGVFEFDNFAHGTLEVAKMIADCQGTSVVGGGDSVAAVNKFGLADKISHVSTGGGASLEFLEGRELPGILVLEDT